jgi:hypothetical protein
MRLLIIIFIFAVFLISSVLNCTLYSSTAQDPFYGNYITEKAEKDRDVFLLMYITAGSFISYSQGIKNISLPLVRRAHKKTFGSMIQAEDSIGPYATRKTFDLLAALVRILYWIPPVSFALFLIVLLLPRNRPQGPE